MPKLTFLFLSNILFRIFSAAILKFQFSNFFTTNPNLGGRKFGYARGWEVAEQNTYYELDQAYQPILSEIYES